MEDMKIYGVTKNEVGFVSQLTGQIITESHLMEIAIDDSKYFPDMTVAEILSNIYILKKGTSGDPSFTGSDYIKIGHVPYDKFSVDELYFA